MKNKITDNTINHKCSMCGQCCGFIIPLTQKEVNKIKQYVQEHNIKPESHKPDNNTFDSRCCFLDRKTNKCKINEVKPFVCKNFKCDRKDWKQRREHYDKRAKYNSLSGKIILASFDDLIYNDIEPIVTYITTEYYQSVKAEGKLPDTDTFIPYIKKIGREDLLKQMKFYDDKDQEIKLD